MQPYGKPEAFRTEGGKPQNNPQQTTNGSGTSYSRFTIHYLLL
jgi:hypothetical protein